MSVRVSDRQLLGRLTDGKSRDLKHSLLTFFFLEQGRLSMKMHLKHIPHLDLFNPNRAASALIVAAAGVLLAAACCEVLFSSSRDFSLDKCRGR